MTKDWIQGVSGSDKAKFTSNAAYSDDTMPSNISKSAGPYKKKKSGWDNWYDDSAGQGLKSGGLASLAGQNIA